MASNPLSHDGVSVDEKHTVEEESVADCTVLEDTQEQTGHDASELSCQSVLALTGSVVAYFSTVGFMNAYGVFQQYYTANYLPNYSNFQISWLGSFASFILFASAAPAGILADRYGPTIPIAVGSVLQLIAVFMISLCTEYYQFFLAQGVLLGVGMGFVAIPTSTIVPQYFKKNRALAQGVSIGGSSLGGIIWPVALDQLLNHDNIGFGWSMRIVGFVMIPLLVLVNMTLRKPRDSKSADPTESQSLPEMESKPNKKGDLSNLRQPAFVLLCLGLALSYFGFWDPLFYVSTYAVHIGASENLSFYMLSVLNGGSLAGRILPGFIADRVGHFNMLAFCAFGSSILCFTWTAANTAPGLIVWTAFYGFVSGSIMSLQLVCATVIVGPDAMGAALGITMASVSLTGLFGTPVAGELVAAGGYAALSCFAGGMMVLGGFLLTCARFARNRRLIVKA